MSWAAAKLDGEARAQIILSRIRDAERELNFEAEK